jgi:hypothetical protein
MSGKEASATPPAGPLRQAAVFFLCVVPFLDLVLVGVRALRVPGIYETIGGVLFAAIVFAGWATGGRAFGSGSDSIRTRALAGSLLLVPWTVIALLWVGLSGPWDATASENVMRYLVLMAGSVAVAAGFVLLSRSLEVAGERFYSTLGFAANIMAGPAYLVWTCFQAGAFAMKARDGQGSPAIVAVDDAFDALLFAAGLLTYIATASFAVALGRAGWLGRGAARFYLAANGVAILFLVMRGLSYPDATTGATPWYASPGFIVGIPAVPWIMPFLLGIVVLRHAARHSRDSSE